MRAESFRVGQGFDAHRFAANRKLIIGGVDIPFNKGLLGHSDADVLIHAIADAVLGALGERDIGVLFPDTDESNKNLPGFKILETVRERCALKVAKVTWLDSIIIAQEPHMSRFIPEMKQNIANALNISRDIVSIKATTTEGMGFTGRKEGIAALAVVMLRLTGDES